MNPDRGCTRACVYCLWGGTSILMANGRTRPLAHVAVGDAIRGTVREDAPGARRLADTRVLAKWSTLKPAYRVLLQSGAELIASGDHRFLASGGWRHVSAREHGGSARAHLEPGDRLVGIGDGRLAGAAARRRAASAPVPQALLKGALVGSDPALVVRAVQPLGLSIRMYDITTGTGDFIAEGVVSHNCCARPTQRYLGFDPGRDFDARSSSATG